MGWEYFLKTFSKQLAEFFKASGDRWSDAATKIGDGTYTSDELQTDIGDSLAGTVALWASLLSFVPRPDTPLATKKAAATDLTTKDIQMFTLLRDPITSGTLSIGDTDELILASDSSKALDATPAVIGTNNDELRVTVLMQASTPDTGVYYGAVFRDSTELVALVTLQLT